ncbi:hypothetical protein, partial [Burkholderia pseudomallei]
GVVRGEDRVHGQKWRGRNAASGESLSIRDPNDIARSGCLLVVIEPDAVRLRRPRASVRRVTQPACPSIDDYINRCNVWGV